MIIKLAIPLSLSEIAKNVDGILTHGDALIHTVCTDSREVSDGELFIALTGKRLDGNEFAQQARARGAYVLGSKFASVLVSSTSDAILKLVKLYKGKLPCLLHTVAITGSVGKTTTKELAARLLSARYRVHSSIENYNNDIGLLHTTLSAERDTEILIIEMGMNHRGEISRLARAAQPDVALITNIGTAHIGNLGSREAIAAAKLEITDGMSDGLTVVPFDEPLINSISKGRAVSVNNKGGDYSLFIEQEISGGTLFSFVGKNLVFKEERVALCGEHLMKSLAFALSCADILKLRAEEIIPVLKCVNGSCLRQRRIRVGKHDIYDDTYSSSPEAAIAVMRALSDSHEGGISAVLGDMLELGGLSEELHRRVGEAAARCGITKLYTFGKFAEWIAEGARSAGMPADRIFSNEGANPERTAEQVRASYDGELIIVKASHSMHAEQIYDFLKE